MRRAKVVFYITGEDDAGDHFKHDWQQCVVDVPMAISPDVELTYRRLFAGDEAKISAMIDLDLGKARREVFEAAGHTIVRNLSAAFDKTK